MQDAAAPEHPNKCPGTPHPWRRPIHFWNGDSLKKIRRAAACWDKNIIHKKQFCGVNLFPLLYINVFSLNTEEQAWNNSIKNLLEYLKEKGACSKVEDIFL
jgi:hypothetical protein